MPGTGGSRDQVSGPLRCRVICLPVRVALVFMGSPGFAQTRPPRGRGIASCGMGSGAYLFGAAFAAIALYAGFRLCRLLFPAWSGYCFQE